MESHSNALFHSRVVDYGDLLIIQRDLVPKHHKILHSPCNSQFHCIGNNTMRMQDYVVLSIYFSNAVVIVGDASEVRVLGHQIGFQCTVVQIELYFKFIQGQSHHCTSSWMLSSEYTPSLLLSGKLYRHVDSSLGCLEARTRRRLSREFRKGVERMCRILEEAENVRAPDANCFTRRMILRATSLRPGGC
jgi:hypothetical protein